MTDAIADGMDARSASKNHQWLIRTLKESRILNEINNLTYT